MNNHSCRTYFSVNFEIDNKKNIECIRRSESCLPKEIGIFNKDDAEKFIVENFSVAPEWHRHHFVIGNNENYDVDVNKMLRETLKSLLGKEEKIREMQDKFGVSCVLEIVPHIVSGCEEPNQYLSLEKDIVKFLYLSDTAIDLDYYVI